MKCERPGVSYHNEFHQSTASEHVEKSVSCRDSSRQVLYISWLIRKEKIQNLNDRFSNHIPHNRCSVRHCAQMKRKIPVTTETESIRFSLFFILDLHSCRLYAPSLHQPDSLLFSYRHPIAMNQKQFDLWQKLHSGRIAGSGLKSHPHLLLSLLCPWRQTCWGVEEREVINTFEKK